jgi:hypothetical protein
MNTTRTLISAMHTHRLVRLHLSRTTGGLRSNSITDNAENFAQEVIVGLFDKVVPGGIGSLVPNWNDIFHQYATVQAVAGDRIIPGGTCNRFFEDEYVPVYGIDPLWFRSR